MKRVLDVLVSAALLVLFSPFWILLILLIKADSRGPVLFTTTVLGRDEAKFTLYKFRSMLPGSNGAAHREDVRRNFARNKAGILDAKGRPIYKTALVDPQGITRIGRFLRRTSLDEIPQLWNVLRGEMSLVGPRPALPYEAELYEEWQRQRFLVKPGLTGLYQVTARNRVPIPEMVRMDVEYVQKQSLALDFKILAKTPFAMFSGM